MSSQSSGGMKTGAAGLAAARAKRAAVAAAGMSTSGGAATRSPYPPPPPCLVKLRVIDSSSSPPYSSSLSSSSFPFPSSSSKVLDCLVSGAGWLTSTDAVKQVVHVEISLPSMNNKEEEEITWKPGDSVGILCQNPPSLVDALLQRLLPPPSSPLSSSESSESSSLLTSGDQPFVLEPLQLTPPPTTSSSSSSPHHLLHISYPTTLRTILSEHLDITTIPKRNFLRFLADHCSSKEESSLLLDFSDSRTEKRELYRQEIEEKHPSLLDLLLRFPSCHPPIPHLLSGLLPLQPRLYSITNSCISTPHSVRLAYTVVEQEDPLESSSSTSSSSSSSSSSSPFPGRTVGLCSGWLTSTLEANGLLEHRERNWKWWSSSSFVSSPFRLRLFFKASSNFVLPHILEETEKPIIMVGPGTGVAPFLSYLDHRRALKALAPPQKEGQEEGKKKRSWLFFGCRHPQKDFLYREEMEKAVEDGMLDSLVVAFSRFSDEQGEEGEGEGEVVGVAQEVKYVQHRIAEYGSELLELMLDQEGRIYVCGDAKGMAKAVMSAFQDLIQKHLTSSSNSDFTSTLPEEQARAIFANWMKTGRFILEAWA